MVAGIDYKYSYTLGALVHVVIVTRHTAQGTFCCLIFPATSTRAQYTGVARGEALSLVMSNSELYTAALREAPPLENTNVRNTVHTSGQAKAPLSVYALLCTREGQSRVRRRRRETNEHQLENIHLSAKTEHRTRIPCARGLAPLLLQ